MRRRKLFFPANRCFLAALALLALAISTSAPLPAWALIEGGEGNDPISDPGWPKGAANVFNHPNRVAYWVGPPFGGGQWHAECRGDAKVLSAVLADFAKIDAKSKSVVVHSGVGHSFWLNPNRDKAKAADARLDWTFMVWQPASWERLRKLPADLRPTGAADADAGPPVQIDIYSGNLKWAEVTMPEGLKVIDNRMEAHGFMPSDGVVLEGIATDLATKQPLAAKMRLERIENAKGSYNYTTAGEAVADAKGRWVLRKTPAGWFRVVIECEGYVPRIVGHAKFDEQPCWNFYGSGLARSVPVSGRISDDAGKPLADVKVRLADVVAKAGGGRYESPSEYKVQTDAEGQFRFDQVPEGSARVWIHKKGYSRPGLGETITTPKKGISLSMSPAANVRVTVDFGDLSPPNGYIVHLIPEGGEAVGKWSGSGNIDVKNQISFQDVPPGKYEVWGMPNPGSDNQKTKPLAIDLNGGVTTEVKLMAK